MTLIIELKQVKASINKVKDRKIQSTVIVRHTYRQREREREKESEGEKEKDTHRDGKGLRNISLMDWKRDVEREREILIKFPLEYCSSVTRVGWGGGGVGTSEEV